MYVKCFLYNKIELNVLIVSNVRDRVVELIDLLNYIQWLTCTLHDLADQEFITA